MPGTTCDQDHTCYLVAPIISPDLAHYHADATGHLYFNANLIFRQIVINPGPGVQPTFTVVLVPQGSQDMANLLLQAGFNGHGYEGPFPHLGRDLVYYGIHYLVISRGQRLAATFAGEMIVAALQIGECEPYDVPFDADKAMPDCQTIFR